MNPPGAQASIPGPDSALCRDDASYVLGTLTPAERLTFETHLADCPACQTSVARLAGLPSLLSLLSTNDVESEAPTVPATLLPNLLSVAARESRRRRFVWIGSMAAAAACIAALVITLLVAPANTPTAVALPQPVPMTALVPGPMAVSLQLVDKQWGTSIVINCHYSAGHDAGEDYQLVAFDATGKPQDLGWWMSVAGGGSTVTTASSLRLRDISRVEVRLASGLPVLSATPEHS